MNTLTRTETDMCSTCNGREVIRTRNEAVANTAAWVLCPSCQPRECEPCGGTGRVSWDTECPQCHGTGEITAQEAGE